MAPVIGEVIQEPGPSSRALTPTKPGPRVPRPVHQPEFFDLFAVSAPPTEQPVFKTQDWIPIKVSAQLLSWPVKCAACLGAPDVDLEVSCSRPGRGSRIESKCWRVPYCRPCFALVHGGQGGAAVRYDGWHGTIHSFRFWNARYAKEFAEGNLRKLVR